jgi:lysophospholipase L1-like esterase
MVYKDNPEEQDGTDEEKLVNNEEVSEEEEEELDTAPLFDNGNEEVSSASRRRSSYRPFFWSSLLLSLVIAAVLFTLPSRDPHPAVHSKTNTTTKQPVTFDSSNNEEDVKNYEETEAPQAYAGPPLPPIPSDCSRNENWPSLLQNLKLHGSKRCDAFRTTAKCPCPDPTRPAEGNYGSAWRETHKRNMLLIEPFLQPKPLDILLLGDSITEHWIGTEMGGKNQEYVESRQVFMNLFYYNPDIKGMALGISGDRCPQLLYRLQNGELPPELQVPIVWINIGTNDIAADSCNADAIVAGNIGIVQEVLLRPNVQRVVIHSLLPRGDLAHDREWQIIRRVNQRLQCYADSHESSRVEFFNSTDLFLNGTGNRNATLYHDVVHPSAAGYLVWGNAILQRVQKIRAELANAPPAPVPAATKNPTAAPTPSPIAPSTRAPITAPIPLAPPTPVANPASVPPTTPPLPPSPPNCDSYTADYTAFLQSFSDHPQALCDSSVDDCKCLDPKDPVTRDANFPSGEWMNTSERNQNLVQPYLSEPLDILLVGDSLTERWLGTKKGMPKVAIHGKDTWQEIHTIYLDLFQGENAKVTGLALGIDGDRCPHLLWRMQNKEFPQDLQVSIVWITIGTNDVGIDHCSADAVVAGNIAVVEEVLTRPNVQRVVINSLLPRGNLATDRFWLIHRRVNHQLECYANRRGSSVEFFNATDLFVSSGFVSKGKRNAALFEDTVHPSPSGYRVWGNAIFQRVEEIKAEQASERTAGHVSTGDSETDGKSTVGKSTVGNATVAIEPDADETVGHETDGSMTDIVPPARNYPGPPLPPIPTRCEAYGRTSVDDYQSFVKDVTDPKHPERKCDTNTPANECVCTNPKIPSVSRQPWANDWKIAAMRNLQLVRTYVEAHESFDVLLLGDSITEHWLGTHIGKASDYLKVYNQVYQEFFRQPPNDSVDTVTGLALGISGDRCAQLLYRLINGELPRELQVAIIWINIGTNDLVDNCNADCILAANIVVVEEILLGRSTSTRVVINSLLPRGDANDMNVAADRNWQILRRVNHGLQCYAQTRGVQVEFFNATSLFLSANNPDERNATLYADSVHPSATGYRMWGRAIVQRVREIKAELAEAT